MRRVIKIFLMLLLAALVSASCVHKELCYHHPHQTKIRLEFDWRYAPDADPAGMCVFFYPVSGGAPVRMDFRGREGGEIYLTVGEYRILCYNNDTESVLFANTNNADSHLAYTREGDVLEPVYGNGYKSSKVPKPVEAADERVVITPDMIWGCSAVDVSITESKVVYTRVAPDSKAESVAIENNEQVIILYPHEMLCNYTYEVRNIKYLKHVTQVCGSLSGMAGMMILTEERLGKECVTLPFAGISDGESKITGQFYTFGHHEDNDKAHRMVFYVWMDDGRKFVYGSESEGKFNVTEQIHNAPDRKRVHIIIDGLDLPKPIENGGGYKPSVDGWGEVHEDIIM